MKKHLLTTRRHVALCLAALIALSVSVLDVSAASYSSSRSGGSSFKSSGSSFRSSGSSSSISAKSKATPSAFKSDTRSTGSLFGKSHNDGVSNSYASQTAAKSYSSFRTITPSAKPKYFPSEDLSKYRTQYANNETYKRAKQDNDSWGSRTRYYQSHQPVVVNGGSNNFGLLSGMFLYSLLNNSASAGEYGFNHQRDADYLKWRAEADQLAKTDAELKAKLDKIDAAQAQKSGVTPDPNWLPEGVPVSATLSDEAIKASQPDFNVCVGSDAGPYYKVAQDNMLPALVDIVNLNPVATNGTPDILVKIASGACDAGFIQGDAKFDEAQLTPVFRPFLEAGHLACSIKVKGSSINHLADQEVWIPVRSGSRMTWDSLVNIEPSLAKIRVRDAVNYEDAILKTTQANACLFYMAAPHASSIDRLIDRPGLKLMAIDSESLTKNSAYQSRTLSSSDYSKAIASPIFSDGYVKTIVTPATFVIGQSWQKAHSELAAKVSLQLVDIEKQLKHAVKQ